MNELIILLIGIIFGIMTGIPIGLYLFCKLIMLRPWLLLEWYGLNKTKVRAFKLKESKRNWPCQAPFRMKAKVFEGGGNKWKKN